MRRATRAQVSRLTSRAMRRVSWPSLSCGNRSNSQWPIAAPSTRLGRMRPCLRDSHASTGTKITANRTAPSATAR